MALGSDGTGEEGLLETRQREVYGTTARYYQAGIGRPVFVLGDPLLGMPGVSSLLREIGDGLHRVTVDLPGFGGTPPSEGFDPDLEGYVRFFGAALQESGLRDMTLVLQGFAVLVGLRYLADDTPEVARRVGRVVILNGPLGSAPKAPSRSKLFAQVVGGRRGPFHNFTGPIPRDRLSFRRRVLEQYAEPRHLDEVMVEEAWRAWSVRGIQAYAALARRVDSYAAALDGLRSSLRSHRLPVLVLWGEEDPFQGSGPALQFQDECEEAAVMLLPDVGALPQVEIPHVVGEEVRNFTLGIPRRSDGDA